MSLFRRFRKKAKAKKQHPSPKAQAINNPPRPGRMMMALEPRYLYDAAGLVTGLDLIKENTAPIETPVDYNTDQHNVAFDEIVIPSDFSLPQTSNSTEIIFIDPSVDNYEQLVSDISTTAQIVFLDAGKDGISQITSILDGITNINAVHILSHGGDGQLVIGDSAINGNNIGDYSQMLSLWDNSLTADADILLYGCNVAATNSGVDFVSKLANLTQADVAASDDLTGNAAKGGDWVLEVQTGDIESDLAFSAASGFQGVLATPTLVASTPTMTGITENDTGGAGQTVAAIAGADISGAGQDGIAIYATSSGNGTWQFNDGSGWTNMGNVSNTKALLLSDTSSIRFEPDGNNATSATFSYYAWDASTGLEGVKADVSTRGGGTDYSSNSDTASITVSAVNDAPVLDNTGTMTLTAIDEDSSSSSGNTLVEIISSAGADRITDVDSSSVEGIAIITTDNTNGTWQYSTDGTNFNNIVGALNTNALLLDASNSNHKLRFVPTGNYSGTATITFRAWDQSAGAAGTYVDASTNGGTTAFSSATETATITINAINDAPTLDNSGTMTLTGITEDQTSSAGDLVSAIIATSAANGGNAVDDVDSGAVEGIAIYSLDDQNGTWQYSTDAGANFYNIGTVGTSQALLLRATDYVRFVPDGQNAPGSSPSITFYAWDQSTGSAGSKADVTTTGTTTAFSTANETATIAVSDVNDTPSLTANATLAAVTEDTASPAGDTINNLFSGLFSDVDSGSSLGGLAIIGNTANAGTEGWWEYSSDNTNWFDITTGVNDGANALAIQATSYIRFRPFTNYTGTVPDLTVRALDDSYAGGWSTTNAGQNRITVNTSAPSSTTAFANSTDTISTSISAVNDGPSMANLNANPTFIEDGAAIVFDNDATITDIELDAANNYNGATLTLARNGGANSDDVYANSGTLSVLTEGAGFNLGGGDIGTVTTNSGGTLVLTFNSSATAVNVDTVLQLLTYSCSDDTPPANVQIDFTFNDQNSGSQGSGGALSTSGSITVDITATNDAPVFTGLDATPTFTEDGSAVVLDINATISDGELDESNYNGVTLQLVRNGGASADDVFANSGNLGTLTEAGNLVLSATTIGTVTTNSAGTLLLTFNANATPAMVDEVLQSITYSNSSNNPPANVQIDYTINDQNAGAQGGGGAKTDTGSITVTVNASNDAPVMDNSGTMTLTGITEDQTASAGDLVSAIIATSAANGNNAITDVDSGAVEGIAIYSTDNQNGTWQYTTDGGTNWYAIGTVNTSQALLLRATDSVRFVPDGQNAPGTNPTITFYAWDQSTGTAGSKADATSTGGTTPFSTAFESASITVTGANDAPVLDNSGNMTLGTVDEDETAPAAPTVATIIASAGGDRITDVDTVAAEGIAVIGVDNTNGNWQYNIGGGWINFSAAVPAANSATLLNASANIRFIPTTDYVGTANITFLAWDTTSGANGDTAVNPGAGGGTTAYSTASETATITVTNINDAPTLAAATPTMTSVTEDEADNAGQLVSTIVGATISDGDASAVEGIAVKSLNDNSAGTWEYSIDGGTNWTAVGTVSDASALLLRATDYLRFNPTASNAASADITYYAWDQTTGSAGSKVDVAARGGTTAYSTASDTASISITAVNDAPTIVAATPDMPVVTEDETTNNGQDIATLVGASISDVDTGASEGIAIYSLSSGNGTWQYNINGVGVWNDIGTVSSTSAILLRSVDRVRFVPNAESAPSPDATFSYYAWDQTSGTQGSKVDVSTRGTSTAFSSTGDVASISVTNVNDAPVLDNTQSPTLTTISEDNLTSSGDSIADIVVNGSITDVDGSAVEAIAVTVVDNTNGVWQFSTDNGGSWTNFSGTTGSSVDITTSARLLDGTLSGASTHKIRFVPDTNWSGSATITFKAWDKSTGTAGNTADATTGGTTTAFSTATDTAALTVSAANDAPVLDNSGTMTLTGITEDQTASAGDLVSAIIATSAANGGNAITDVDSGAVEGIAVYATDNQNGTWQYTTDGGTNWYAIGTVNTSQALLLRATDSVRFVPNGQNPPGTNPTITFYAWDTTSGTAGSKVDATSTGGTTAFSTAAESASITVSAANDAPVLDNSGNMSLGSIDEDETAPSAPTVAAIIASAGGDRITDVDTGAAEGIAVIGVDNTNGNWQYNIGGGWINFSAAVPAANSATLLNAAANIRFIPTTDYVGTATITFQAWDTTSGANGDTAVDPGAGGGTTAYSTASETATITVTNINDAPTLAAATPTFTSVTEDEANNAGQLVSAIVGATISDTDSGAVEGIAIKSLNDNGAGTWEYSIDGGTNWFSVGAVSDAAALLLRSTDYLRFNPTASNAASADITYYAWDQTSGTAGTKPDVSTRGNTTAYSTASDTASISITAVNDAPTLTPATPTMPTISEDETSNNGQDIATLVGASISDVDTGASEGIAIYDLTSSNGSWEYKVGAGAWTSVGTVSSSSALLLESTDRIRFVPGSPNADSASFSYYAWDTTSGSAGNKVDASTQGTTTAFSTANDTASITVTAVNDAPVLVAISPTMTTITEDETNNAGQLVSAIVGSSISDVDTGAVEGVAIYSLNSGTGTWQYNTGGGWNNITPVATNSALLLRATDSVRFVPNGTSATTGDFTYYAWDTTSGTAGNKVDATTRGTTTAFSSGSDTASITVTEVNDPPTITNLDGDAVTFTEGGAAISLDEIGVALSIADAIDSPADFNGGNLTVAFQANSTADDRLTVANIGTGAGQIGASVTPGNITYEGNIIGTWAGGDDGSTSLVITFTTTDATPTAITALAKAIRFDNGSANPGSTARTIRFTVDDGDGGVSTSTAADVTVNMNVSNDAPVVSNLDGETVTFTEGGGTILLDQGTAAAVSDVDSPDFDTGNVTVAFQANCTANDRLTVKNIGVGAGQIGASVTPGNVTYEGTTIGTWAGGDAGTGGASLVVTLNSSADLTAVTALVKAIEFNNVSDDPDTTARTIRLTVNDGDGTDSTPDDVTVNMTAVNDAPTLTATGDDPTFTEGGAVAGIFSASSIGTVEAGQTVDQLIFTVTNVTDGASEIIAIDGTSVALTNGNAGNTAANTFGYSVALAGNTATVTISKSDTPANYQTLVDGLTYSNTSQDPTAANRVVTLTSVQDSGGTANGGVDITVLAVASTVTVQAVNDAPTLTATGDDPTFTEGGAVAGLFSASSIGVVESGQTVDQLIFTVTNVTDGASEIIAIDGTNVALTNGNAGNTAANTFGYSVALAGNTATVTISKSDTTANYQTLVNNLTYSNTSDDPTVANRVVTLTSIQDSGGTANGGADTTVLAVASTVTMTAVNDAPTLTATGDDPTFTEGGAVAGIFSASSIGTVEAGQTVDQLIFTVTNVTDGASEIIAIDGTNVALTNGNAGNTAANTFGYSVALAGNTATVTLSKSDTPANYQTLVDGLTYSNTSQDPTAANRVVTLTSIQDSGGTANGGVDTTVLAVASTVTVQAVNDAPTLTATGDDPTFTEGGAVAGLFSASSIGVVESGQTVDQLIFTVTNVTDGASEIIAIDGTNVALTNGNAGNTAANTFGYSVALAGNTATVTISKSDTTANYQTLVNNLTYSNTSDDPTVANRVVTLTSIQDSGGTANGGVDTTVLAVASTVTMTAVNDAPTLTATGDDPTFTEDAAAAGLFSASSIATVEAGQTIDQLIFTVTNVTDGADEIIAIDGTNVALTNGNAGNTATNTFGYSVALAGNTATVTISKSDTTANYQTLVDNLTYSNTNNEPTTANRVVTLTSIQDSGGTANGGVDTTVLAVASTVTVLAANDAPTLTATGDDPTFTEGGAVAGIFSASSIGTVEAGQTIDQLIFTVTNVTDGASEIIAIDGTNVALTNGNAGNTAANTFGYSVALAGNTATVTLSKSDTPANYQTLVDNLTYNNTSQDPTAANRVVTLTSIQDSGGTANGGVDTTALAVASTVTVQAVNDAPTLTATGDDPTFTEDGAAAGLFSASSIGVVESGQTVDQLIFTVTNVTNGTDEIIAIDGTNVALTNGNAGNTAANTFGYSVALAGNTATVTISKSDTTANYQTLVDNLTYSNTSDDPTVANRVVTLTSIQDSGGTANGGVDTTVLAVASTVTMTAVNDAPTFTATGDDPTFTEGGAVAGIFSASSIGTIEAGQTIDQLIFTVTNVTDGASEIIAIDGTNVALTNGNAGNTAANTFGYSVALAGNTATVTISKSDTTANYQTLVDGLTYSNTSQDPTAANRVVTLTSIQDSGGTANGGVDTTALAVASTVTVQAVNDAPTLTATGDDPTFTEDGAAAGLFSASSIGVVESGQTVDQLIFTVTNVTDGTDEIIAIDGTNVALTNGNAGNTAANTFGYSVALAGNTATVTISKSDTTANYQTLVDNLTYSNTSDDPTVANRVVTLTSIQDSGGTANGGVDTTVLAVASTVTMTAVNDAPTLTATGDDPTFTEGGAVAGLFSASSIGVVESGQTVDQLIFTVTNVTDGASEIIAIDGTDVALTNGNAGNTAANTFGYSVALAGNTATITISKSDTTANYQTLVDNLTYSNTSQDPTAANRVVTLTSIQDSGGTANGGVDTTVLAVTSTVTLFAVNDAPTLTATGDDPTFTEGGAVAGIFSASSIGTVETGQTIDLLIFTVTNVSDGTDEIIAIDGTNVALTNGNAGNTVANTFGYSVALAGSTATVTISKSDTTANYQTLVDNLTYSNTSDDPTVANRVVTLTSIQDSGGTANSGSDTTVLAVVSTVTVQAVNDAPTLTATGDDPTFTEDGAAAGIFSASSIGTVEAGQTIDQLIFTVTNVTDGTDEIIAIDGTNVALTNGNAGNTAANTFGYSVALAGNTATVTISKSDTTASYQTLVDGLTYSNTNNEPTTANRVVTLTSIQDSGGTANGGVDTTALAVTSTVTVQAANDAPALTATGDDPTFTEGGAVAGIFSASSIGTVEAGQTIDLLIFTVTNVTDGASEIIAIDGTNVALTNGNAGNTAANTFGYSVALAGNTATVTISKSDTTANYQTLVDNLTYSNTSQDPTAANRVVTLTSVQDSGGTANGGVDTTVLAVASTVTVQAVNDAPTLTATGDDPTFTENGAAAGIFSGAAISAVESSQTIDQLVLTITNVTDGTDEILTIDGSNVTLTNANIGATAANVFGYNVSLAGTTATVTISKPDTSANYQTLVNALAYSNTSDTPTTANRVVTLTSIQDSGGTTNGGVDTTALAVTSTVTVAAGNDAPSFSALNANPNFVEDGSAVVLDNNAVIVDPELDAADNYNGATLTIVRNGGADGDDSFANTGNLSVLTEGGNFNLGALNLGTVTTNSAGTLLLTFSANATASDVDQVLQSITYANSNNNPPASVLLDFTINDGNSGAQGAGGALTGAGSITVTITGANDAPSATNLTTTSAYNEDDPTVAITDIVVSDPDTGEIITATLTLADTSTGVLTISGSATYNSGTGVWTITDTLANVNTALANVSFTPAADNDVDTTIGVNIADGGEDGATAQTGTITLDVTPAQDLPTSTDSTVNTVQNFPYTFSATDFPFTDVDTGDTLSGVEITTIPLGTQGTLTYNPGVSTAVNASDTISAALLNTLTFTPALDYTGSATFSFRVIDTDGPGASAATYTMQVDVVNANAPVITVNGSSSFTFVEGDAPLSIGTFTILDVYDVADEIINAEIQIVNGANWDINQEYLTYDLGTTGIAASFSASTGLLSLSGTATAAQYTSVLNSIQYEHQSETPTSGTRSITLRVQDNDTTPAPGSFWSSTRTITATVNAVNDTPVFAGLDNILNLTEGDAAQVLDNNATISDIELDAIGSGDYSGAILTLARNGGANTTDVFANSGNLAALTEGGNLTLSGVNIGTVTTNSSGTLLLTFNTNATSARVDETIQSITYQNTSNIPPATMQIDYTFSDGNITAQGIGGAKAATGSVAINITEVNDAPSFTNLNGTPTFVEAADAAAPTYVVLDADATIADLDLDEASGGAGDYNGATLTLQRNGGANSDDLFGRSGVLSNITEGGNFNVGAGNIGTVTTNSGGTLVLTFNSSATSAAVDSALQAITYANSSDNPTSPVAINYTFDDASGSGSAQVSQSINVTITSTNDAPSFTNLEATHPTGYIENDPAVTIDPNATISDPELDFLNSSNGNYNGAILTLRRTGGAIGDDVFDLPSGGNITVGGGNITAGGNVMATYTNAAGQLQITFTDANGTTPTTTLVNEVQQAITYSNSNNNPPASINLDFILNDGSGAGNSTITQVMNMPLFKANDAPTITGLDALHGAGYTEDAAGEVIDINAVIADAELDALNAGNGNYSSAVLTLARTGGANANDVFAIPSGGNITVAGGNISASGNVMATFINSGGQLQITFTDANGTTPTTALVNEVLQAVTYANSNQAPPASVTLDVTFNDGNTGTQGVGNLLSDTEQITFNLTAVNDAPLLDNSQSPSFSIIQEDDTNSAGNTVAEIIVNSSITDVDLGGVIDEAIAVTAVDNTNGLWQFSTDNGGSWTNFSGTTGSVVNIAGASRLLDGSLSGASTHKIRFVPNTGWDGTADITFRAWDKTAGTAGLTADTSGANSGGTTPYSTATDTASIKVNADPVAVTDTITTDQNQSVAFQVLNNDTDSSNDPITLSSFTQPSNGTLTDNGNGSFTYSPNYGHHGTDSFTYSIIDDSGGSNTGTVNLTIRESVGSQASIPEVNLPEADTPEFNFGEGLDGLVESQDFIQDTQDQIDEGVEKDTKPIEEQLEELNLEELVKAGISSDGIGKYFNEKTPLRDNVKSIIKDISKQASDFNESLAQLDKVTNSLGKFINLLPIQEDTEKEQQETQPQRQPVIEVEGQKPVKESDQEKQSGEELKSEQNGKERQGDTHKDVDGQQGNEQKQVPVAPSSGEPQAEKRNGNTSQSDKSAESLAPGFNDQVQTQANTFDAQRNEIASLASEMAKIFQCL